MDINMEAYIEFKRGGEVVYTSHKMVHLPRVGDKLYLMEWPDSSYVVDSVSHFYGRNQDVHTVVVDLVLR